MPNEEENWGKELVIPRARGAKRALDGCREGNWGAKGEGVAVGTSHWLSQGGSVGSAVILCLNTVEVRHTAPSIDSMHFSSVFVSSLFNLLAV